MVVCFSTLYLPKRDREIQLIRDGGLGRCTLSQNSAANRRTPNSAPSSKQVLCCYETSLKLTTTLKPSCSDSNALTGVYKQ